VVLLDGKVLVLPAGRIEPGFTGPKTRSGVTRGLDRERPDSHRVLGDLVDLVERGPRDPRGFMRYLVITTINPAHSGSFEKLRDSLSGWEIVVVGDKKTPNNWACPGVRFISIEEQIEMFQGFAKAMPFNSYSRKNIGYAYAIRNGASIIAETDDDNYPYGYFLKDIKQEVKGYSVKSKERWLNIYQCFTKQKIWPRGFPLDCINASFTGYDFESSPSLSRAIVQQYLENGDTDVDAIYRLTMNKDVEFAKGLNVFLEKGQWCPFNSQNTVWFKDAFALMYLPSFVSFRMTDIWRSFVVQACLHAMDERLVFCSPTVYQKRNEHNLMADFDQEIPGYQHNKDLVEILSQLDLQKGKQHIKNNAFSCYRALHDTMGIITKEELNLLELWFNVIDVK
jgi:hypothetical protein